MRSARTAEIMRIAAALAAALAGAEALAGSERTILSDGEDVTAWAASGSSGVQVALAADAGPEGSGRAVRVDFDFARGSGFAVFRLPVRMTLPTNFRLSMDVRSDGPPNNFEIKFIDETGDNVWWFNRRGFEFPREWTTLHTPRRRLSFAWGPGGAGKGLREISAIEFAVTAGTGGKGSVLIDNVVLEELPEAPATWPEPRVSERGAEGVVLDLGALRAFGGVRVAGAGAAYAVDVSSDGARWTEAISVQGAGGRAEVLPLADAEARYVRVRGAEGAGLAEPGRVEIGVLPLEVGDSKNELWRTIAREGSRRELYPKYLRGLPSYWTVIGASGDANEALINEEGAIEVRRLGFSVEPLLVLEGRAVSGQDSPTAQSLREGYLPIPSVEWKRDDVSLRVTAAVDGPAGRSVLAVRYEVGNESSERRAGEVALAIRPLQVLPPAQDLNITGGAGRIERIRIDGKRAVVDGVEVRLAGDAATWAASTLAGDDIMEWVADGRARRAGARGAEAVEAHDPMSAASGVWMLPFDLGPGERATFGLAAPMSEGVPLDEMGSEGLAWVEAAQERAAAWWRERLNRVSMRVPAGAQHLVDTLRSTVAYILINRDGAAIQPGSRSYERTWIRDGSLTSTALLYTGNSEEVREFVDWFAPFQYEDGKVPCCADARGPDPVPEHDSHGQYIYAVATYDRFVRDDAFVARHWPRVKGAVAYIESLRAQRMTKAYASATGLERAKFGLVPESISHEGYSAKPMHSYWDNFYVLRGLKDAAYLAERVGDADEAARLGALAQEFREALLASLDLAMREKKIEYVPGCVELGDFDPTSTSAAIFPVGEMSGELEEPLRRTFDRYWKWFEDRATGRMEWRDYTPYELRNASSFLMLGQPERAHGLLEFLFRDQRPRGWNHWAEIVWRDESAARFIGDMPHTWVGSDFVKAVRNFFVYERESDAAVIVGAGVKPEWLSAEGGVSIAGFPTEHGVLGYSMVREADEVVIRFDAAGFVVPPGGVYVNVPGAERVEVGEMAGGAVRSVIRRWVVLGALPESVRIRVLEESARE
ncbi:MAG: coagulation factor 5/8 type domain-containing protein [Planctomycetota bacterium]|nr:coagulation factor 5/8 type domain-containing protein [Planctomycetota bacterium]